jgi:hypothetical protein
LPNSILCISTIRPVIFPYSNIDEFTRLNFAMNPLPGKLRYVFYCRIEFGKGFDILIEIFMVHQVQKVFSNGTLETFEPAVFFGRRAYRHR